MSSDKIIINRRVPTIGVIAHTAKILRRGIEKKIEDVLEEDQFGFRRGKGSRMQLGC